MKKLILTRVIKCYVKDEEEIVKTLDKIGAEKIKQVEQIDYFFNLPKNKKDYRLKLRYENNTPKIIYYYNSKSDTTKPVKPTYYDVKSNELKNMLETFLGIDVIIKKHRSIYKLNQFIFNLDKIQGVGIIFEIEEFSKKQDKKQTAFLLESFKPFLGKSIKGSNEDLVKNNLIK